jgi:murein DD-endopeptidase MepM/ murein hydrolase activator NlpD
MSALLRRRHLVCLAHPRITTRLRVCVVIGLSACLSVATASSASADPAGHLSGAAGASGARVLDVGHHPAAPHETPLLSSQKAASGHHHRARPDGPAKRHRPHGTDTNGGDGSATDRDLAIAATWQVDPALLQPQLGDSAETLHARAELAAVTRHLHVVLDRYTRAHAAALEAEANAESARAELSQARLDAAAAHRVYVRDHRTLVQMVVTSYEQGPVSSMQFLLTLHDAHDVMVGVGTMQQLSSNEASVVSDAEAALARMRETADAAARAAAKARAAKHKADDAYDAAARAGHRVVDQVSKARNVLTLSVLADQLKTNLAEAMKYAAQLKPGSVSFPLPPRSGFYDNHNWGQRSAHWKSLHTGDDYSVACGTPVLAATAGTIRILTDQRWAGRWLVMVSTGQGKLTTWYAHMEALAVHAGQHVKPGQIIGAVGDLGNATGCHLHFELHPDGGSIYQDTTDPDPWLRAVGALPGG